MTTSAFAQNPNLYYLNWLKEMGADELIADTATGFYNFKAAMGKAANTDVPQNTPAEAAKAPPSLREDKVAFLFPEAAPAMAEAIVPPSLDGVKTLAELRQIVANFDGCAIKKTAKQSVFSDGNPESKIMFIGEAPGAEEDRIGKPFVGPAGQLLDRMLGAINLDRSKVYISNIVFWRPPGNRNPSPEEMEICMPFVKRHIEIVRPKLLICLGGIATKAMFQRPEGVMKLRGKWLDFNSADATIPTLITYHPSFLLRTPSYKKEAWTDLQDLQKRIKELGLIEGY